MPPLNATSLPVKRSRALRKRKDIGWRDDGIGFVLDRSLTFDLSTLCVGARGRQNMRKLMLAHPTSFPAPVHEGSASVWHLAHVLRWLADRGDYAIKKPLLDVATVAMQVKRAKEARGLNGPVYGGTRAGRLGCARTAPYDSLTQHGLDRWLADSGMTQTEAAKALGVTQELAA
jgi:hypothetical protein